MVTFNSDAQASRNNEKWHNVNANGQNLSKFWFPLAFVCSIIAKVIPNVGCANNPIARSETARLRNIFFKVMGIDEAFRKARMTRRFPRIATTEKAKISTQRVDIKVP